MNLIQETKKQAEGKRQRTRWIIEQMIEKGYKINYQTVANAAGVSRTYLYKYQEFRDIIELCRISRMTKQELQKEVIRLRRKLPDWRS